MRDLWKRCPGWHAGKPLPHSHQENLVPQPAARQDDHQWKTRTDESLHPLPEGRKSKTRPLNILHLDTGTPLEFLQEVNHLQGC